MALAADRFKFRPSYALGISDETPALFFDMMAAVVVAEFEADSYKGVGSGGKPLPHELKKKADDRFKAQELIRVAQEAKRL